MLLQDGNIKLRALEPTDLELLYSWENNTDVWSVSNTVTPFSKFVLYQYLESQHLDVYTTKQLRLLIEDNVGRPVGLVDLFDFDPKNLRAGLGILINDQKERGKGYSKGALQLLIEYGFNHLGLYQIYVNVGVQNQISLNLFKSLGFVEVGIKKGWIKTPNGFEDEVLLQLIKG